MDTVPYWKEICDTAAVQEFIVADVGYMPERSVGHAHERLILPPVASAAGAMDAYLHSVKRLTGARDDFLSFLLNGATRGTISLHVSSQMLVFDLDLDEFGRVYSEKRGCPADAHAHGELMCIHCWRQLLVACVFLQLALTDFCATVCGLREQPRFLVSFSGSRGLHVFVHPRTCPHLAATNAAQRREMYNKLRNYWHAYVGAKRLASLFGIRAVSDSPLSQQNPMVELDALPRTIDASVQPPWMREWFNGDPTNIWLFSPDYAPVESERDESGQVVPGANTSPANFAHVLSGGMRALPIDMNLAQPRHSVRAPLAPNTKGVYASTPFVLDLDSMSAAGAALPQASFAVQHTRPASDAARSHAEWKAEQVERVACASNVLRQWLSAS